ncbi:MAG: diguanylate cyclase [Pseudomonadota bacterium]
MADSSSAPDATLAVAALEQLADGVLIAEAGDPPRICFANPAWERMTGYPAEEVHGRVPGPLDTSNEDPALVQLREQLAAGDASRAEFTDRRRDGSVLRVACSASPTRDAAGTVTHYTLVYRDREREAEASTRMHQLETLVRIQAELAAGTQDLERLRQRVVDTALELTGAEGAAIEEIQGDALIYRAVAGIATGNAGLRIPLEGSLTGRAYTGGESLLVMDTATEPHLSAELQGLAQQAGFRSGVLVPLSHEGRAWGVLKVYAREPGRFGEAERHLLELASGVLAASLHRARDYADELDRRSLLLDAVPALISYIDAEQRYREVNAAYRERFGIEAEELRNTPVSEFLGQEGYDRIRPYLEAALAGERVSYENDIPLPDGTIRTLHGDYLPHRGTDGRILGLYAIVRDITDHRDARIDYLTGLLNRREFEAQAQRLLAVAQRYQHPVVLVMADIDHFKSVNDDLGHLVGDEVLQGVARTLRADLREADLAGRWGGEEFVLVLPETSMDEGHQLVERLRRAVASQALLPDRQVTVSFGLAQAGPGDSLRALQSRADRALYRAKRGGRNRVEVDREEEPD